MKFIASLISVYILALSFLPCADMDDNDRISTQTVAAGSHHSHQGQTRSDCSPFCTCACCGSVFINLFFISPMEKFDIMADKNTSLYIPFLIQEVSFSIWQPPKVC